MNKFLFYLALAISAAPVLAQQPAKSPAGKAPAASAAAPAVSPELAQKREARKAEIEHWLTRYDGYELKDGKFACRSPRIPAISKDNAEITAVGEKVTAWQHCYNAFVDNLNKQEPPEQRIPKDVFELMTPAEREQAIARIKSVKSEIGLTASVKAKTIMADYDAWRAATEAWVDEHNKTTKQIQEQNRGDYELRRNNGVPKTEK
ncbi:MAG TPA: sel1 repeat family protein [Telluria sp.]|nr:sel1 repeat family protein [Telluria sp.]